MPGQASGDQFGPEIGLAIGADQPADHPAAVFVAPDIHQQREAAGASSD